MSQTELSDENKLKEEEYNELELTKEPSLSQDQRLFLDKIILRFSDSLPIDLSEIKTLFVNAIMKWERNHYRLFKYQEKRNKEEVYNAYSEVLNYVKNDIVSLELLPKNDLSALKNSVKLTRDFMKKQLGYKSSVGLSIMIILFLMFFVAVLTVYAILFSSIFDVVPISYWNFLYFIK